jgi:hypothetical protein
MVVLVVVLLGEAQWLEQELLIKVLMVALELVLVTKELPVVVVQDRLVKAQ